MDGVKVWCLSVCFAAVVGTVIMMLTPSIEKNKILKAVISVFILSSVISPMIPLVDSMDFSFGLYNDIQNNVSDFDATINLNQMLEKSACEALYPIIKEKLIRYGIDDEFGITVKLFEKTEGYEINCVNIVINNERIIDKKAIEEDLLIDLGLNVVIYENSVAED
jgi:hypothetical protein